MAARQIECLLSFSALPGGNRNNNGNFNNTTNNGNWWSSTENNTNNAYNRNLNYNNSNLNRNNNNKENGFSVRCVRDLFMKTAPQGVRPVVFIILSIYNLVSSMQALTLFPAIDKEKIILELFQAYYDARKNKRNTINALAFEKYLEQNLFSLADEIVSRAYTPRPSICFIVDKPVKREIFAADFRDRVVHHFIYNHIASLFENRFINDSYSCRKGKGTHYGIQRINHFIRSCSQNYQKDCYILKLDIRGYFMSIYKPLLYDKIRRTIEQNSLTNKFDTELMLYLLHITIFNDSTHNCIIRGSKCDWEGLPPTKSLFYAMPDCGLPIGNLTSQLFGNVYMDSFDHWVKKELGIQYYGRYVDDFILMHADPYHLKSVIPRIRTYLKENLHLTLHPNKVYLQHFSKGVNFLGAVIKPHRIYVGKRMKGNFYQMLKSYGDKEMEQFATEPANFEKYRSRVNSYLGMMKHYKTYKLRRKYIFDYQHPQIWKNFYFTDAFAVAKLKKS